MPRNNRAEEIRSDEVQEILSSIPHWLIRWGITVVFGLVVLLLFLSWFIKYPDTINGKVTLTTEKPVIRLVAKQPGIIQDLKYSDNSVINQGDNILTISSQLSQEGKDFLVTFTKDINRALDAEDYSALRSDMCPYPIGEIHLDFNELRRKLMELKNLTSVQYAQRKGTDISKQITHYKDLITATKRQLDIAENQEKIESEQLKTDLELYNNGAISRKEYEASEKNFLSVKSITENHRKTLILYDITIAELSSEINSLQLEFETEHQQLIQEITILNRQIQEALNTWKSNYVLSAPISGTIVYINNIDENRFVKSQEELIAIIPQNEIIIGQIKIPSAGMGKIQIGQSVKLKLDKYPSDQFGSIEGKVTAIDLLPNEDVYDVSIELTNGLTSNRGEKLAFSPEMTGTAEIITEDLRVIDRILNTFRR